MPSMSMVSMRYHQQVWFNSGLWHMPGQSAWYRWYTVGLVLFVYFLFPLLITVQLWYATNIEEFTSILLIWPTAAFGIKASLIAVNRRKFIRLFGILREMDECVQLDAHRAMVWLQTRQANRLVWFFSFEYYLTITTHLIVALVSRGPVLMWPAWLPWNYADNYAIYIGFNIYLYLASLLNGYVFTSLDLYGVTLYKLLGAHLDILAGQLKTLGHDYDGHGALRRWQRRNERRLHDSIRYHMLCSSYANLLNSIISVQYFLQFGMSIAVICGSEFKLITLEPLDDPVEYANVVLYMVGLSFEIFLPCYIGSIVLAKSKQLLPAVYEANWMEQSAGFKASMLIFGERVKRPITPKAGGLFVLELPMFVSTIKLAYSLLAVLQKMD